MAKSKTAAKKDAPEAKKSGRASYRSPKPSKPWRLRHDLGVVAMEA